MFGFRSNSIKKRNSKSASHHEKSGSHKARETGGNSLNLFGPARSRPTMQVVVDPPPEESPPPPETTKSHPQQYGYKYIEEDNSSVDMSLYTTNSKSTVRYPPQLLNHRQAVDANVGADDSSNDESSRALSEFTYLQNTIPRNSSFESSLDGEDGRKYNELLPSYSTPTTDPTSGVPSEDESPSDHIDEAFGADDNDETNDDETTDSLLPCTNKMTKLLLKDAQSRTPSFQGKLSLRKHSQQQQQEEEEEEEEEEGAAAVTQSELPPTSSDVELSEVQLDSSSPSNSDNLPPQDTKVETKLSTPTKSKALDATLSDLTGLAPPSTAEKQESAYTAVVSNTPTETPVKENTSPQYATPETTGGSRTDADSLGYSASCSEMSQMVSPQDTPSVRDDDTYGYSVASGSVAGQSPASGSPSPSKQSHQPHRTRLFKQWDKDSYGYSTPLTHSKAQSIEQRTPQQANSEVEDSPKVSDDVTIDLSKEGDLAKSVNGIKKKKGKKKTTGGTASSEKKKKKKKKKKGKECNDTNKSTTAETKKQKEQDDLFSQKNQETAPELCLKSENGESAHSMVKPPSTEDAEDFPFVSVWQSLQRPEETPVTETKDASEEDTYGFSATTDVSSLAMPTVSADKEVCQEKENHGPNHGPSTTKTEVEEDESTIEDKTLVVQKAIAQARKDLQEYRSKKEENPARIGVGEANTTLHSPSRSMSRTHEPITPPAVVDQNDGAVSVLSALTPAIVENVDAYGFSVKSSAPHLGQADSHSVNLANVTSQSLLDHNVRRIVDDPFQQTMESSGALKRVTEERCPSPDVEWDEEDFTGAVLLTSKELEKHHKKVQNLDPFPSSTIDGYDSWRRQNEYKRRYFAKLHANMKEQQRRAASDFYQPSLGSISGPDTYHQDRMDSFRHPYHPYHARSDPGVGMDMSTRTPMERSMDSSIPTFEDSDKSKTRKQKEIPRRRSNWGWLRPSKKKIKKKSGKLTSESSQKPLLPPRADEKLGRRKKTKKDPEPEIVSLSHFMRISADESLDVEELSLAPLNDSGLLTIGDSTIPADTLAATKSHCVTVESPGRKQLAKKFLEEERAKQLQAEADKDLEERLEWERIARRKQEAIEQQRRMNLPQGKPAEQQSAQAAPMKQSEQNVEQYGGSCRDWKPLAKKSSFFRKRSSSSGKILAPCIICNSEERTHLAMPCMHFYFCEACVDSMHQASDCPTCPVCSTENVAFTRVFTG